MNGLAAVRNYNTTAPAAGERCQQLSGQQEAIRDYLRCELKIPVCMYMYVLCNVYLQ